MNFRFGRVLLFILVAYPLLLFSQDAEDLLRQLSSEQYLSLLLSHSPYFPNLVTKTLSAESTSKIINKYRTLKDKIEGSEHYDAFLQKASRPLLTLEVTREIDREQVQGEGIDRSFLTQWRDSLIRVATHNKLTSLTNIEGKAAEVI